MKVVQIRGCNASGKSSIVKGFIERNGLKEKQILVGGVRRWITSDKGCRIVVLGKYGETHGGCDGYPNAEAVFNTLFHVIKTHKPEVIIFEGFAYGKTVRFAKNLSQRLRTFGYEYTGIVLELPFEVILERFLKRSGVVPNVDTLYSTHASVIKSYLALKKLGVNVYSVKVLDYRKEEMYKILEKELEK